MHHGAITTLQEMLRPHVGLSKRRLETLRLIVVGMINARTVNLSQLACERSAAAPVASTCRRLPRFVQHVHLGTDRSAPLVVGRLGLAVITRWARAPPIQSVLDTNGGFSDSGQRIALVRRNLAIGGAASVRRLLADWDLVGCAWMNFLTENDIPFAIRMTEKLIVTTEDGRRLAIGSVQMPRPALLPRRFGPGRGALWLNFAARRLKDGALLLITSNTPTGAAYRNRWAIEFVCGDTKIRSLNLEYTHFVTPRKLALPLDLAALVIGPPRS